MGRIIKKLMGDVDNDPTYQNFTVELNADGIVHIHQGNIRLDLPQSDWKKLCDALVIAKEKVNTDERNPFITAGGIRLG